MTKLHELAKVGQGIWLDDLRRQYLTSGRLAEWVEMGLRGLTSNPTIFDKAISGSADYDQQLRKLAEAGKTPQELFEALEVDDLQHAADVLRPVYDATQGEDGYASLEVSPGAAFDTQATVEEAARLFAAVNRPNVMVKIPATPEGMPAIRMATARGININITLIFSIAQYQAVTEAFIAGLEERAAAGEDISHISSVASFFVSRVDTEVDKLLQEILDGKREPAGGELQAARELQGKIAIANAKLAYACFQQVFSSERWKKLEAQGARVQRPLWASTGAKNPAYPDTMYIDNLIGPHTVNTVPPKTIEAVLDHGLTEVTVDQGLELAQKQLAALAELGIDLSAVTDKLLADGIKSFEKSFADMIGGIEQKQKQKRFRLAAIYRRSVQTEAAAFRSTINAGLAQIAREKIVERIWASDYTVWKPDPAGIDNRLGWLQIAENVEKDLPKLETLVEEVRAEGYTHALLLGMGGSSLAAEVIRKTYGVKPGYLDLAVLDSTDPGAVLSYAEKMDPVRTLILVSTKSGGTVETLSFFKYFYNEMVQALGEAQAGRHFVAITDPDGELAQIGEKYGFRATLLNDPNIGGRFSALSLFGLAPAALIGANLRELLDRAQAMVYACGYGENSEENVTTNPAVRLGVAMGELARVGCDKLTLITSPAVCTFGDWVEQLVAESTGKNGKGILPVVGESLGVPEVYGKDRFFVYLRLSADHTLDAPVLALEAARNPVVRIEMQDLYDLGAQFFLWELATAIAGQRLGIQPYDQPNVEAAKQAARSLMSEYKQHGKLPEQKAMAKEAQIGIYADIPAQSLGEAWKTFLSNARQGAYIAIHAYIPPTSETDASLLDLRTRLRERTGLAVTTGYGPRFLHSTGQIHKGGQAGGLFVQITAEPAQDAPIPDEAGKHTSAISFGVLEAAQALGDRQALLDAGRQVLRFHIENDVLIGLARLSQAVS